MKKEVFKRLKYAVGVSMWFLIIMWSVKAYELVTHTSLGEYGIFPRDLVGLRGVLFMPFLHGDISHIAHNSIPVFVLMSMLIYFYRKTALFIIIFGNLLAGILTWLIAKSGYHIGASVTVYMLFSYMFFSGIFRLDKRLMAVSLLIIFIYGSLVWGIFPFQFWIDRHVSWEGHLSGMIAGFVLAYYFRKISISPKQKHSLEEESEDYEQTPYWIVEEEEKTPLQERPSFKDLF